MPVSFVWEFQLALSRVITARLSGGPDRQMSFVGSELSTNPLPTISLLELFVSVHVSGVRRLCSRYRDALQGDTSNVSFVDILVGQDLIYGTIAMRMSQGRRS